MLLTPNRPTSVSALAVPVDSPLSASGLSSKPEPGGPLDSLHSALDRLLADYPGVIEQAAKFVYLHDSDDTRDDWAEQSHEFRELYRSEVRLVLEAVDNSLPERLRAVA